MFVLTELVDDIEDGESPYVKLVGVYDKIEDAQHVMQDRFRDALYRETGDDCDDDDDYDDVGVICDVGVIYNDYARIDGEFVIQVFNIFDTNKIQ